MMKAAWIGDGLGMLIGLAFDASYPNQPRSSPQEES